MPQIVTEDFYKSLRSSPTGKRKNGTIFDELYCSLQSSENPLDRAIQTIAEFHGPWTGSSVELTDFTAFLASKIGSSRLLQTASSAAGSALAAVQSVSHMQKSSVRKYNPETCAIMPTPLLREFTNRAQKLHPSINMYIQMHIGTFPYFQQVSEDIGQFASIVQNATSIDPMQWPNKNGVNCLDTNSRMNKNTLLKMAAEVFQLMDDAQNVTNALFLRAMPKQNNMSFMHTGYSKEKPIAHGHNFTMDVFNAQRNVDAIGPCIAAITELTGDVLRLINKFFCIKELARYEVEGFEISMNEGPNNEPITYIVDNTGRPLHDSDEPNDFHDPTNETQLGSKKEYKDELQ
jgi:hypothetical protein